MFSYIYIKFLEDINGLKRIGSYGIGIIAKRKSNINGFGKSNWRRKKLRRKWRLKGKYWSTTIGLKYRNVRRKAKSIRRSSRNKLRKWKWIAEWWRCCWIIAAYISLVIRRKLTWRIRSIINWQSSWSRSTDWRLTWRKKIWANTKRIK